MYPIEHLGDDTDGPSEPAAGVCGALNTLQMCEEWEQVKEHVSQAQIIFCDLHSHPQVALQLAACAVETATKGCPKTCVGVSSPLVWARTTDDGCTTMPGTESGLEASNTNSAQPPEVPYTNSTLLSSADVPSQSATLECSSLKSASRRAAPSAIETKQAEDALLLRHDPDRVRTYVVCPGLLYGRGECDAGFHGAFASCWRGLPGNVLPVLGNGNNCLPMVHVADLSRYMLAAAVMAPEERYLLVADDTTNTQKTVMEAISTSLGSGAVVESTQGLALVTEVCPSQQASSIFLPSHEKSC